MIHKHILAWSSTAIITASLLSGCVSSSPVGNGKQYNLISESQELSMGKSGHQNILRTKKVYNNKALQAYVNRVGKQLASHSHRNKLNYRFTVLEDASVNAFALPGGYIYITTGILAHLNSEGELAGVLAHEIGHVAAKHNVQRVSAGVTQDLILQAVLGGSKYQSVANVLGSALVSGYGRKHELEADKLGAEYLARSNYDPQNMIRVIGVLKAQQLARGGDASYHGLFDSHPNNDLRLQEVIKAANKIKSSNFRNDNRNGYFSAIRGIPVHIAKKRYGRLITGTVTTPGLTYEQMAKKTPMSAKQLRLLNGDYPKGQPKRGSMIKSVQ